MSESPTRVLLDELSSNEELRKRLLADPVGTMRARGLSDEEVARVLRGLLAGEIRIEGWEFPGEVIRSPWPPTGDAGIKVHWIAPIRVVAGVEFEFTVRATGVAEGDIVAFRIEGAGQYMAKRVSFESPDKLRGKGLIGAAGAYDVIVANLDHYGVFAAQLLVE